MGLVLGGILSHFLLRRLFPHKDKGDVEKAAASNNKAVSQTGNDDLMGSLESNNAHLAGSVEMGKGIDSGVANVMTEIAAQHVPHVQATAAQRTKLKRFLRESGLSSHAKQLRKAGVDSIGDLQDSHIVNFQSLTEDMGFTSAESAHFMIALAAHGGPAQIDGEALELLASAAALPSMEAEEAAAYHFESLSNLPSRGGFSVDRP